MDYTALSKAISYALRHAPDKYGLDIDKNGWADLVGLLNRLRMEQRFISLSEADICKMIEMSEKKRHEIYDGKIRALYGHSVKEKIMKEPTHPPDVLYHGTAHKFIKSIFATGLISKGRQYVHLSEDVDTAITVGKRRDDNPIVLIIDTKQAWSDGILFYIGNDNIWLADDIPVKYISLLSR